MQPTSNRQLKTEKAFTLIELLVVVAIVGILAGLAVVNMSGATEAARIAKLKVYSNSIRSSMMGNRVSEWRFDEGAGTTTADTVGTNIGTLANFNFDTASGWRSGSSCVSGGCLQFDGVNDYVSGGSAASLNITDAITLEAWIKRISLDGTSLGIVSKDATGGYVFLLSYTADDDKLEFVFPGVLASGGSTKTVADTNWHHVVVTVSKLGGSSSVKFYVDGVFDVERITGTTITGAPAASVQIGKRGGYFNGLLDEVRVYSAALTASAVHDQYLVGLDKFLANGQITQQDYQQRLADLNLNYAINE
jgi:prepilin-type N-terminal cleavage/methylation domain-containing protein